MFHLNVICNEVTHVQSPQNCKPRTTCLREVWEQDRTRWGWEARFPYAQHPVMSIFFRVNLEKRYDVVKREELHWADTLQKSSGLDKEPGRREAYLESSTAALTAFKKLSPPPLWYRVSCAEYVWGTLIKARQEHFMYIAVFKQLHVLI